MSLNLRKKPPPPALPWFISSACTLCGNCIQVCPTQSIFLGNKQYFIDADTCDGNAICATVCPVNAIHEVDLKNSEKR